MNIESRKALRGALLPALVAAAAAWPALGAAQAAAINPEAVSVLRRSTDFLSAQKQFRMDTQSSIQAVMDNGQKLQFDHHAVMTVQRPNKMRTERMGEIVNQVITYDGKSIAVNMREDAFYATASAPATLEAALDFARDDLKIVAPGADLIHKDAFELLSAGMTAAYFVGEAMVAGVRCDHLAFRNAEVDWQIFIEQGAKPLPRKFVVTSKRMAQAPEFTVVITKWDLAPKLSNALFSFTPPQGARKIEFVSATMAAKK